MYHAGMMAVTSGLGAQVAKVLIEAVLRRRWRPTLLFASGGMPSSHTATVTTLSYLVARQEGTGSAVFSLVLVFSLYVVFEATGLRQEVGKQAELLNELLDEVAAGHRPTQHRLKELVGHTWQEVFGGFLFGFAWAELGLRVAA